MNGAAMYAAVQADHKDQWLLRHAPLVRRIAHHLLARLPNSVRIEDLLQAGMLGLIEAEKNYDAGQGASFETYAGIRVRGAMLDEVRRYDWTPRSVHRKTREITEAIRQIEAKTGADAKDQDVADFLGISLREYHRILQDSTSSKALSLEAVAELNPASVERESRIEEPLAQLSKSQFNNALKDSISALPERERLVLSLYYVEELNLKEIGEVLNISESRVSQINNQALTRLKARLEDWRFETEEEVKEYV